jgi:hypothetical protein
MGITFWVLESKNSAATERRSGMLSAPVIASATASLPAKPISYLPSWETSILHPLDALYTMHAQHHVKPNVAPDTAVCELHNQPVPTRAAHVAARNTRSRTTLH